jgi:predicted dehydrogenase
VRRGDSAAAVLGVPKEFLEGGVDPIQPLDPYQKQSAGPRQFIDAVISGSAPATDFSVGVKVQKVVDAALVSAREDRWVRIDEPSRSLSSAS